MLTVVGQEKFLIWIFWPVITINPG